MQAGEFGLNGGKAPDFERENTGCAAPGNKTPLQLMWHQCFEFVKERQQGRDTKPFIKVEDMHLQ